MRDGERERRGEVVRERERGWWGRKERDKGKALSFRTDLRLSKDIRSYVFHHHFIGHVLRNVYVQ